ncbi:aldehyde dehydrogenase family protein [Nocardia sp. NPDC004654]|uniref:aldehyde dehydrogenase family protein n=1 Tax=Nocardia sp. NPDC004654 TaxID=3154776 RepID=UPI0033A4F0A1
MAIIRTLSETAEGRRRLALISPIDRHRIGELEVSTPLDVERVVARARAAQPGWAALPVRERARIVRGALDVLVRRREEIIDTVHAETGKPRVEALTMEIVPSCDFLNHWTARAERALRPERRRLHGYLRPYKKLFVHYQPLGVVGVITPWNGPFVLSLNPVVQALLAGNAVILKPSEITPRSGEWVVRVLRAAGVPDDVVQVLHGDGETGAALVRAGLDKISFTGSVATGRNIGAACGATLTPCTLELGGKDAMIVCADADLERAAAGAVYLSMFNCGQVCLSVERVYVVDSVADEFIRRVREKAERVRYRRDETVDVGPFIWDKQLDVVRRHLEDARDRGASILIGGAPVGGDGLHFEPTVLVDVTHDMAVMTEETFGPVVAIMRVRDEDEAVRLANDSPYGLSGSVFTEDTDKARRIATRLVTGSVVHNDAAVIYGVTEAPFGGRKNSGLGHINNGSDGLRGYTHQQPILITRRSSQKEHVWYPYDDATERQLNFLVRFGFGTRILRRLLT